MSVQVAIAYANDSVTSAVVDTLERLTAEGALTDASVAIVVTNAKGHAKVRRRRALDGKGGSTGSTRPSSPASPTPCPRTPPPSC